MLFTILCNTFEQWSYTRFTKNSGVCGKPSHIHIWWNEFKFVDAKLVMLTLCPFTLNLREHKLIPGFRQKFRKNPRSCLPIRSRVHSVWSQRNPFKRQGEKTFMSNQNGIRNVVVFLLQNWNIAIFRISRKPKKA